MPHELLFPALSTMIALAVYYSQAIFVSFARKKDAIPAPKTSGNDHFERVFRVHYNTLENLPIFLVSLWFFAVLVNATVAGYLGLLWSVGRIGYMYGYYKSAEKRHSYGSILSYLAIIPLIAFSFWAIISGLIL